jgi:hypothetical protein
LPALARLDGRTPAAGWRSADNSRSLGEDRIINVDRQRTIRRFNHDGRTHVRFLSSGHDKQAFRRFLIVSQAVVYEVTAE